MTALQQLPPETIERAPAGTSLYVHLPFCAAKCTYCDFFSLPADGQDLDGTLDAILAEAESRAPQRPRTVFLGGGTPSLYSRRDIGRFLDALDAITDFRSSAVEVTAECNPESLDVAKARALLAGGVTRLSVGVQSLRADILEFFGRVHDAEQGLRALHAAREAGVERLSADLIFAAPGLATSDWEQDLERVLAVQLDHLSAYSLTFEEGTPLYRWRAQGKVAAAPEETELEQFLATREITARYGFEAYEISNFAQTGQRCLHNESYWQNADYCGIGPSAVSKVDAVRFGNSRNLSHWRRNIDSSTPAVDWHETRQPLERLTEAWWLGLRTADGVDPVTARQLAGVAEADDPCVPEATRWAQLGLVETKGGRTRLTERGLPLADGVASKFLELV